MSPSNVHPIKQSHQENGFSRPSDDYRKLLSLGHPTHIPVVWDGRMTVKVGCWFPSLKAYWFLGTPFRMANKGWWWLQRCQSLKFKMQIVSLCRIASYMYMYLLCCLLVYTIMWEISVKCRSEWAIKWKCASLPQNAGQLASLWLIYCTLWLFLYLSDSWVTCGQGHGTGLHWRDVWGQHQTDAFPLPHSQDATDSARERNCCGIYQEWWLQVSLAGSTL